MNTTEYLLSKLIEECSEVIQRATKAQTFGLHEKQPGQDLDNAQRLTCELIDMLGVMEMMDEHHMVDCQEAEERVAAKKAKVIHYAEYSFRQGCLTDTKIFPPGHPLHNRTQWKPSPNS